MDEIEVKILEIDVHDVTQKLERMGAKKEFEGDLFTLFFDKHDRSLTKAKQVFRLRKKGDKTLLTFKIPIPQDDVKAMDEHETEVKDFDVMRKILEHSGFNVIEEERKHRASYRLGKVQYEIERREGIPPYLEIEATSKQALQHAVEELGFKMADTKPWGGGRLLKHYGKKTKYDDV